VSHLLKWPFKVLDTLADRIVALVGAASASQVPGFMAHYVQHLGGSVAEAARNVEGWRAVAMQAGAGSVQALGARYLASIDPAVIGAGRKCLADVDRLETLQSALHAVTTAPAWARLGVFLRHLDGRVARGTLAGFVPNVPLDAQGLVYALCGLVLALALYHALRRTALTGAGALHRRLRRRRPADGGGRADTPPRPQAPAT
jgi:hypothetical protein